MDEFTHIIDIIENILGESRRGVNLDGWTEYNCPNCASIDGVESDGKYNLCINYKDGIYHCWKCLEKGRLSKIIKKYGTRSLLNEYYTEINSLRKSNLYKFCDNKISEDDGLLKYENCVELPSGFEKLYNNKNSKAKKALEYLKSRGIDDYIIKKFNIGYVGWSDDFKIRNRIIIPSYDESGELNYWVGRDYTGKNKMKYKNPDIQKTKFIFNENNINWYEDLTLVEGVFDHMVIPNSVPLLGKYINEDFELYHAIMERQMANINIMLDEDAYKDMINMYIFFYNTKFKNRIRIITYPNGIKDASELYQKYNIEGIKNLFKTTHKVDDYNMCLMSVSNR